MKNERNEEKWLPSTLVVTTEASYTLDWDYFVKQENTAHITAAMVVTARS